MRELSIDLETYSETSLKMSGMHKYVQDPAFEILLFGYSFDAGERHVVDLMNDEEVPQEVLDALKDPNVKKTAWNAAFELACLNTFIEYETPEDQWECTMVKASMCGYPLSLDLSANAIGAGEKKDAKGKALIKYFCEPCKPSKSNGYRTRNFPWHDPVKWEAFKEYCRQDVVVESLIGKTLKFFKIPQREKKYWLIDQKVNNVGIMLDVQLVQQALALNDLTYERLKEEARRLTGLTNPNSLPQLKKWLEDQIKKPIASLTKDSIKTLLKKHNEGDLGRVLNIRQEMAKSSVKKYKPMMLCHCDDECARGLFQFYGANKTGRWSSRLIQLHNLVKNKMPDIHLARQMVRDGMFEEVELLWGNVPSVLSQLCRTAFIPRPGKLLLPSDFSAIEARVVAWFANEKWRLDVFKGHGKIYEASGAQMFKIPIDEVKGDIRSKAKVAELALGYQGSVGALERMGALEMGIKQEELKPLVDLWRKASPNIVRLWYDVDEAAIEAVQNPGMVITLPKLKFVCKHNILFIQLPSGRFLSYVNPTLKMNKFDKTSIQFYGVHEKTKKWSKLETYGGKLVENIVQGTSRDILAEAMTRLDEAGFEIVMHVHDEIVSEVPIESAEADLELCDALMSSPIEWLPGLPLKAESFITPYYLKQ